MFDPSGPLANRGPEALQRLLVSGATDADTQLRLLTMTELVHLASAGDQLAALARRYVNRTCDLCRGAIFWVPTEMGQPHRAWQHVDQAAADRIRVHTARPSSAVLPPVDSAPTHPVVDPQAVVDAIKYGELTTAPNPGVLDV